MIFNTCTTHTDTYIFTYIYTPIHSCHAMPCQYHHTILYRTVPYHTIPYQHMYIHTYIQTNKPTYLPTYLRTCIHTYMHACIHTYIHTYTHTHTQEARFLHFGCLRFCRCIAFKSFPAILLCSRGYSVLRARMCEEKRVWPQRRCGVQRSPRAKLSFGFLL